MVDRQPLPNCRREPGTRPSIRLVVRAADRPGSQKRLQVGLPVPGPAEVAEHVIAASSRAGRHLDMRLLKLAFGCRIQVEDEEAGCSWRDLVDSLFLGRPTATEAVTPIGIRAHRKAAELERAREIADLPVSEQLETWRSRTGKSQAAMYRRLAELGVQDSDQLWY